MPSQITFAAFSLIVAFIGFYLMFSLFREPEAKKTRKVK
jgi:hypothetical protein